MTPAASTLPSLPRESELRAVLAELVEPSRYALWFGEEVRLGLLDGGETLEVQVPNEAFGHRLESRFTDSLIESARRVSGRDSRLRFRVSNALDDRSRSEPTATLVVDPGSKSVAAPRPGTLERSASVASQGSAALAEHRGLRTFDEFVVGPCNQLAHAAALDAARGLGRSCGPLVLHGAVGLGKTHLLESLHHLAKRLHPSARILHLTAEAFTNRFLEAIRGQNLGGFRARHRQADLLIVDDAHFLAAKRATQDEFLHTYNAVSSQGGLVVVAVDRHPRRLERMSDELRTRFLGGVVAPLMVPDQETRRALIRFKAAARGVALPEEIVALLADPPRASVRELEGALNVVLAEVRLTGRALSPLWVRERLGELLTAPRSSPSLATIERTVARVFGIAPEALRGQTRSRAVTGPRMLAMYLARRRGRASYAEIGRHFGGRNHSTVMAAEKRVSAWLLRSHDPYRFPGFDSAAEALARLERELDGDEASG